MKKKLSTILLTTLSLLMLAVNTAACSKHDSTTKESHTTTSSTKARYTNKSDNKKYPVQFVKANSGQSATFKLADKEINVGFLGVLTPNPDKKEPLAAEAKDEVQTALSHAKQIKLQYDPYYGSKTINGTKLAYIWIGNELLQSHLLQKGLAILSEHHLENKALNKQLSQDSLAAQEHLLGVWQYDGYVTTDHAFSLTAYELYQKNQVLIQAAEKAIQTAEATPNRQTLEQANVALQAVPENKRPATYSQRISQVSTTVTQAEQEAARKAEEERQRQEAARKAEEERQRQEAAARAAQLEQQRLAEQQAAQQQNQQMVWVAPQSGRRYHFDPTCRGLRRANGTVQMTLQEAQAQGYTLCGYE
ncbi:thermonuclease family protein [Enterococcus columbae]|uniref:TNase-like domain-containing protein n=1 Tax=Enterococcus columbae DSM 7374 = ATCC 51263 TaxID=1121865 RepID=S0K5Y1_9ENTE|nr:thermonuclease family protein [Enterococcus columbae]EOT40469.1 hypothetical protein OMW_01331 [Enterococcus columbae DSM 7374 = ATCC 51263]EOW80245.1 hypothetical protein I568_01945 [Enterococcus columbae DSM 7374 = ATCC 51263]